MHNPMVDKEKRNKRYTHEHRAKKVAFGSFG